MPRVRWPRDGTKPGQRGRMSVEHRNDAAMRRHVREQSLDMRARMYQATLARALRGGPARIEPVGRSDRQQSDIATVFRHQADGLDRFRRDRAGVSHDDLAIRARLTLPIGAVDDLLFAAPESSARLIWSIGRVDRRR